MCIKAAPIEKLNDSLHICRINIRQTFESEWPANQSSEARSAANKASADRARWKQVVHCELLCSDGGLSDSFCDLFQEHHENKTLIDLPETALNQMVNIYNVKNSTIAIKGKVNGVSIVSCTKISLLMDSAVSSISITNSPGFTVQITGSVPTITVDATDGGQIYLSKVGLDVEIVTAKCSAINVSLPVQGEEEGIFEEKPIPEQVKTVIRDGKLSNSILEHAA